MHFSTLFFLGLATVASVVATDFHNEQNASINVQDRYGNTFLVGGWDYVAVNGGWAFVYGNGVNTCNGHSYGWPEGYGDVYWFRGTLKDSSGNIITNPGCD